MTISYNLDVSSSSTFSFFKLLLRWKGSIWKSISAELFVWTIGYYIVMCIYRFLLEKDQQTIFEKIAKQCDEQLNYIPLTFMLGFFVTLIVDRWRQIFNNMGWIENIAHMISIIMEGNTEKIVMERRAVIRYLVLQQVMIFRDISMKVRKRFPTMQTLIDGGFLQEHELKALNDIDIPYNKYWAPVNWAMTIMMHACNEGTIESQTLLSNALNDVKVFRTNLALLCNFDWVPIPIAYPQVVFLAVRVYFMICLVTRQHIMSSAPDSHAIDLYVPFMTIFQFICLVGWMKVAETLLNPLGEDDDDYECNFLIDKNIFTGLAIVDQSCNFVPELKKDKFDKEFNPVYSEESTKAGLDSGLIGSAEGVNLTEPNKEIKMVAVKKMSVSEYSESGFDDSRASTIGGLRRRFSGAFNLSTRNTYKHTIQDLGVSLPANFTRNLNTSRPSPDPNFHSPSSKVSIAGSVNKLSKVDEECSSRSTSQDSRVNEIHDDDEDVHEFIRNECHPNRGANNK